MPKKTRRNKTKGGSCPMLTGGKRRKTEGGKRRKMEGGKRRTRKLSKWNLFVKKVHKERKAADPSASFKDSLVEAAARKKAGEY